MSLISDKFNESILIESDSGKAYSRKTKFMNLCAKTFGKDVILRKNVQQHHKDGDATNNPRNLEENFIYLYSDDGESQINAHKYIHAKYIVDSFTCSNVYQLIPDGKTVKKQAISIQDLDRFAKFLAKSKNNNDTYVQISEDDPDIT